MSEPSPAAGDSPSDAPATQPRVALVLGGGGVAGMAFHAGVLLGLEQDLGWTAAQATLIVGTSGGSVVGSLLRSGATTEDLAAWATGAAAPAAGTDLRHRLDTVTDAGWRVGPHLRWQRPTRHHLQALRAGGHPLAVLASVLPPGWLRAPTAWEQLGAHAERWPDQRLWIPAVATATAERWVFGRDSFPPVAQAVAASCAVPGVFAPVRVGDRWYIDGGAHSSTNADLAADAGIDLAVVLVPLAAHRRVRLGRLDGWRAVASRSLRAEAEQLDARHVMVETIEPDEATIAAMGHNLLGRARLRRIARTAFLSSGAQFSSRLRALLRASAADTGSIRPARG